MRRVAFWTAVLVCLAAIGSGGWYAWRAHRVVSAPPQDTVRAYFAALERGDAPAALSYGTLPSGERGWLTSTVLRAQQHVAPIRDVSLTRVTTSDTQASVAVSYRLGFAGAARQVSATITLTRNGTRWLLDRTAAAERVRSDRARNRITLAGAGLPSGPVLLFPGALPVAVDTHYLTLGPSAPAVPFTGGATTLSVHPSAAARAAISADVTRQLTACVSVSPLARYCPLPSARTVPGSVQGRLHLLQRRVHVVVDADTTGELDVSGSITLRGTYRTLTYDNTTQVRTGRVTLPFQGTASPFAPMHVNLAELQ